MNDFFETIKISNSKIENKIEHMNRINNTLYFLNINNTHAKTILNEIEAKLDNKKAKLRISFKFVNNKITYDYEFSELLNYPESLKLVINPKPCIDSTNAKHNYKFEFLKTYYESFKINITHDTILINEKNEVCETTKANIYILKNKILLTPPLSSGCLAGTYRAKLLKENKAKEANLSIDDLKNNQIFVSNALMGFRPAKIEH